MDVWQWNHTIFEFTVQPLVKLYVRYAGHVISLHSVCTTSSIRCRCRNIVWKCLIHFTTQLKGLRIPPIHLNGSQTILASLRETIVFKRIVRTSQRSQRISRDSDTCHHLKTYQTPLASDTVPWRASSPAPALCSIRSMSLKVGLNLSSWSQTLCCAVQTAWRQQHKYWKKTYFTMLSSWWLSWSCCHQQYDTDIGRCCSQKHDEH